MIAIVLLSAAVAETDEDPYEHDCSLTRFRLEGTQRKACDV